MIDSRTLFEVVSGDGSKAKAREAELCALLRGNGYTITEGLIKYRPMGHYEITVSGKKQELAAVVMGAYG